MAFYIRGKGWFESGGSKIGSRRKVDLMRALAMGRENDVAGFTRLVIESRVCRAKLGAQFKAGRAGMIL